MIRFMTALLLGAGALATLAFAAPVARAAGMPVDTVTAMAAEQGFVTRVHHRRGHRTTRYRPRPQILVQPIPPALGFHDPGYAYHGNINGCVVDLGYGRYEPCNGGR